MSSFPDVLPMLIERIRAMPNPPLVVDLLPTDFTARLPIVHVTSGGGVEGYIDRVVRLNVDVYAGFPPAAGEESAEVLAGRVHDWLVPGGGVDSDFFACGALADKVVCDPTPTLVPYPFDEVALVSAAYHVTVRRQ
ncbi:MAG: hypothetical protein MSC45_00100 [Mobiluncus sp.]|uniref:hypothetical protein n=1 Tax=Mobiluncus sp. TaxID=47293 RepID=UPI002586A2C4|nr:hypothetical protein [Mobiluncus sp.]MCI6583456.1 hypothetical protein [Mobiluncus sp.]